MEANDFVAKLKADGSDSDLCDLDMVYKDFKSTLSNVTAKNRGLFSLNVLCILCRNLEKVPSWKSVIDNKALLMLSIDCVRETRCLDKPNQVKALACIYNIHRHVTKLNTPIPPELVLKLSYMAFEGNIDLREHFGTYWNILCDRILYIEKLKLKRLAVNKLLTKLIEDVQKVIQMYDTYNFCVNILVFLLKKLNYLYSDINSIELSKAFEKIFECLSTKNDIDLLKKLSEKQLLDLYVKFLESLVVIAENESKVHFKNSVLTKITKTCISFLAHTSDMVHCLKRFFLNIFCCILTERPDLTVTELKLANFMKASMLAEKLGYKKAMIATYPFVNQFLRLYIDYLVTNSEAKKWTENFTDQIQECCLKLMLFLMEKLRHCKQFVKCEHCKQNSGLHDALRLSFQTKYYVSVSLTQGVDITKVLPTIYSVVLRQHEILVELCALGCANYDKCYKKLQADMHNTAVLLNKAQYYEYSIRLFDVYLQNEFKHFKGGTEMKNISRALYNKSICELDYKRHENALKSAYLSLIFALPESLKTDKHMSLVMDIKAKLLKWQTDNDTQNDGNQNENNSDDLQLMTVLNACLMSVDNDLYGNMKPFFYHLRFGELLKHEFDSYARLWPSVVPVAGVWRSLHALLKDKPLPWVKATQEDSLELLYEVVLETPTTIRTIQSEYYSKIVADLLDDFEKTPPTSPDLKLIYATLLILKTEFDLHEASVKYEWKNTESEQNLSARTIPQEHNATKCAIKAVHVYMKLVKELDKVSKRVLRYALQVAQVAVPLLLHLCRNVEGLQMAAVCCKMAAAAEDKQAFVRNAGTIAYHASKHSDVLNELMKSSVQYTGQLIQNKETMETALVFMCDCAIYFTKCDALGLAANLVQLAQARILQAYDTDPDIKLELAVGRLLEAQTLACQDAGPSALSAVNTLQRHYLGISNSGLTWTNRRLYSLTLKLHISSSTLAACSTSRALLCWRRARTNATGGAAGSAAVRASVQAAVVNPSNANDCQAKIDNRIKHMLGLLPSNDTQPYCQDTESKKGSFTPKQEIETMLKSLTLKKTQVSPSVPCLTVPGFKMPEFIEHACSCQCYACQIPTCQILACKVSGLEASLYFRSNEFDIARNYFDGALKCLGLVESKLGRVITILRNEFDDYIVDIVETMYMRDFKRVELEFLIEASFFELSQTNYKNADENTLRINEILCEDDKFDRYMTNEVMNLTTASAQLRKNEKKSEVFNLESELSPYKVLEPLKTPKCKAKKPPKLAKVIVKDEEVPNTKRRVIKLNLEDTNSEETEKPKTRSKRNVFKIPVPVTSKPVLETVSPKLTCQQTLFMQHSSDIGSSVIDFATPKADAEKSALFTLAPAETPEKFFTPMKSMKKNLESEFAQLKSDKANDSDLFSTPMVRVYETPKPKTNSKVETGSIKSLRVKRNFKRATGKLEIENKPTTYRCRNKPVRFNLEID